MTLPRAIDSKTVDKLAALAGKLYSLPAVALQVLDLLEKPDVDAAVLRECIEKDPALAAKILRVVNSALYSPAQPILDLGQALAFLGEKPLKLLVLGFSLPPRMFQGLEARILTYYWRRSLTKAVAARELSQHLRHTASDECFVVGLLQDLGFLVLVQALGYHFQRFVEKVLDQGEDLYRRERELFGFDHRAVSAALLHYWGMPTAVVDMINPEEIPPESCHAAASLRKGILAASESAAALLTDNRLAAWSSWCLELAAIAPGHPAISPENTLQEIQKKVLQLGEIFSLRLPPGESVEAILARAHDAVSQVAEQAAGFILHHRTCSKKEQAVETADDARLRTALKQYVEDQSRHMNEKSLETLPPSEKPAAITASLTASITGATTKSRKQSHRVPVSLAPTDELWSDFDPGLMGVLKSVVARCRIQRRALSLILIDYQDLSDLAIHLGPTGIASLQGILLASCQEIGDPEFVVCPYGETGCAWLLPGCQREQAVESAYLIMRSLQQKSGLKHAPPLRLRIGISTVETIAPNFPAEDLLQAAERCLFASGACGGGVVKSIEIY